MTTKRLHLSFGECEHSGDLDTIVQDIGKSGGKVIESRVEDGEECAYLTVEVDENSKAFWAAFKQTDSYGFME